MASFGQCGGRLPAPHAWSSQLSSAHAPSGPVRVARQRLVVAACAVDGAAGAGAGHHMFIFGMGYTALAVGNQLKKLGW